MIANTSLIFIFLGSVIAFQNCSNNTQDITLGSKSNIGIERKLRGDIPSFPSNLKIGTEKIGSRIGSIVASWNQEFTITSCYAGSEGSGSTTPQIVTDTDQSNQQSITEGGECSETVHTEKMWEAHSSNDRHVTIPEAKTPVTLEWPCCRRI